MFMEATKNSFHNFYSRYSFHARRRMSLSTSNGHCLEFSSKGIIVVRSFLLWTAGLEGSLVRNSLSLFGPAGPPRHLRFPANSIPNPHLGTALEQTGAPWRPPWRHSTMASVRRGRPFWRELTSPSWVQQAVVSRACCRSASQKLAEATGQRLSLSWRVPRQQRGRLTA